jgi:hypothetical protein
VGSGVGVADVVERRVALVVRALAAVTALVDLTTLAGGPVELMVETFGGLLIATIVSVASLPTQDRPIERHPWDEHQIEPNHSTDTSKAR